MRWLHSQEYLPPRVSVRGPRASWQAAGGKDTTQLARDRAEALSQSATPIDQARNDHISQIMQTFVDSL